MDTAAAERLIARLKDADWKRTADAIDELVTAVELLGQASMLDNGTRRRAQPVDAILDARTAISAALGRIVVQLEAELDNHERDGEAAYAGDVHATGDSHGAVRS